METKTQFFDYKKENGEILNCHYFFSDANINPGTEKVDLFIRFNDPQTPNVSGFTCREEKELMCRTHTDIVKFCIYELNTFFKQCGS